MYNQVNNEQPLLESNAPETVNVSNLDHYAKLSAKNDG